MASTTDWTPSMLAENRARMARGELYTAFVPDLIAARATAGEACAKYNRLAGEVTRREQVGLMRGIFPSLPELPAESENKEEEEANLRVYPWIETPLRVDYGSNVSIGEGTFINFGFIALDTCQITIGKQVLFGPNVQLYSGTHPLDPAVRNGTEGPELGGEITIGDDCWFGGQAVVLPGVKIGRGVTVGAASVVTKNIPPFVVVAGNPARIIKKIESEWATEYFKEHPEEEWFPPAEKK
ncbi:hypothetical protein JCM8547_002999 [Rhodosporidiobolus lusitaniae]